MKFLCIELSAQIRNTNKAKREVKLWMTFKKRIFCIFKSSFNNYNFVNTFERVLKEVFK